MRGVFSKLHLFSISIYYGNQLIMPKLKKTKVALLNEWLKGKEKDFRIDGNAIFCRVCSKIIPSEQKSHLTQHEDSRKHQQNVSKTKKQIQINENASINEKSRFYFDMCNAFVAANIPWAKLDCPQFKEFIEKYCGKAVPDRTTLSKNYLPKCYDQTVEDIRKDIGNCDIWICADETTDVVGRYIANLIVGKLSIEGPSIPHLLACRVLDKTNHATVARFINDSLCILWPDGIKYDRVRLFYSDAAAYMLKCATSLRIFYPKIIHFTCMAHALNRVCEIIRNEYEEVNGLISNTKKIFLKAPMRVQRYREVLPNTPLPPEPILTRWGTWLNAAAFYCENFDAIKQVVMEFDPTSAVCIQKAQQLFSNACIQAELVYISTNFKIIAQNITKLEAVGLPLTASMKIFNEVKFQLQMCEGKVGSVVKKKIEDVLKRNPGYDTINCLYKIYSGEKLPLPNGITANDANAFKFIPVTSCDVERSFSLYKNILTDKRHSLNSDNIEKFLVCYSNNKNIY